MGAQVESFERRLRVSRHLHGARMVMHVVRRWRGRVLWGSWQRWLQEVESAKAAVLALEASEEEARRAAEHAGVLAARSLEESALRAEAAKELEEARLDSDRRVREAEAKAASLQEAARAEAEALRQQLEEYKAAAKRAAPEGDEAAAEPHASKRRR